MKALGIAIMLTSLLISASCTRRPTAPEPVILAPPLLWTQDFPLEELAQQSVVQGECGLALWTRAQPAKRIFFASNGRGFGLINFQGDEVALDARHERVNLVRGFSEQQLYVGDNVTIALELDIETRQDVLSNAVIRSGVFTLTQASTRKSLVVPVVGVIGCS
ncbi:MAG: hypothetical protein AAF221_12795 [Pseudomonadota bacterium]